MSYKNFYYKDTLFENDDGYKGYVKIGNYSDNFLSIGHSLYKESERLNKNEFFTFVILVPELLVPMTFISIGMIWQRIFLNKNISTNTEDFVNTLILNQEVKLMDNKILGSFIFEGIHKINNSDLFKFQSMDSDCIRYLPKSEVINRMDTAYRYKNNGFINKIFSKLEVEELKKIRKFIHLIGSKIKIKNFLLNKKIYVDRYAQSSLIKDSQGENVALTETGFKSKENLYVNGNLNEIIRLKDNEYDNQFITDLVTDRGEISLDGFEGKDFLIVNGSLSYLKIGATKVKANKIIILSSKESKLKEALDLANEEYLLSETNKQLNLKNSNKDFETLRALNLNYPAMVFKNNV